MANPESTWFQLSLALLILLNFDLFGSVSNYVYLKYFELQRRTALCHLYLFIRQL